MMPRLPLAMVAGTLLGVLAPHQARAEETCEVTPTQREEARGLEWFDFDQVSTAPASFRVLANAGCHREALAAYDDWLEHGPGFPDHRSRAIGTFHRGQLHAMLNEHGAAQELIQDAYRIVGEDDPQAAPWNAYLDGVLAWFAGDLAAIREAQQRLGSFDTRFAARQVGVLQGLLNCPNMSYGEAMSPACQAPASDQPG